MGNIRRLTVAAATLCSVQAISAAELSVTPAIVSDYDFRGISQTALDPAVQLGATYSLDNGFYAFGWGSNIDGDSYPGADLELDLGAGFAGGDAEQSFGYDLGLLAYVYPGESDFNYEEIYAGVSRRWFAGKLWYSPELPLSSDSGFYAEGNGVFPLPHDLSLIAHIGYSFGDYWENRDIEYFDFSVGLAKSFGHLDVSLKYIDGSDLPDTPGSDVFATDARVWLSLSSNFPWK